MKQHDAVIHPRELLATEERRLFAWNDGALDWLANHVLASRAMFNAAFILPLVILPLPAWTKVILAVLSSNWIQWWALPALQRQGIAADLKREAKADVDHCALTHIANTLDEIKAALAAGRDGAA